MTKKLILIAILASLVASFFYFGLAEQLNIDYLKEKQLELSNLYSENPVLIATLFFIAYVTITALSLPAAVVLTLAAGAIFGLPIGLLIVSFASSIGATFAFLSVRYLFRESVESKLSKQLAPINKGVEKEGWLYLFSMRLVPIFPFVMVNSVFALTKIKTLTFYITSQIGMLAGTAVYVNAGTQLSTIESLSDIASPNIIISFLLLAIFPFLAKFIMKLIRKKESTGSMQE